jgi:hypothetical protein
MGAVNNTPATKRHVMHLQTLEHARAFNAVLPEPGRKLNTEEKVALIANVRRFERYTGHGAPHHGSPPVPKASFLRKLEDFLRSL